MAEKILFVGDAGTGKTTLVKKLKTGNFSQKYISTMGVEVSSISTEVGGKTFQIWDTAGQDKFGGLRDKYYAESHRAFIFIDFGSETTLKNARNWYSDVSKICEEVRIVANKSDLVVQKITPEEINAAFPNIQCCVISVKNMEAETLTSILFS